MQEGGSGKSNGEGKVKWMQEQSPNIWESLMFEELDCVNESLRFLHWLLQGSSTPHLSQGRDSSLCWLFKNEVLISLMGWSFLNEDSIMALSWKYSLCMMICGALKAGQEHGEPHSTSRRCFFSTLLKQRSSLEIGAFGIIRWLTYCFNSNQTAWTEASVRFSSRVRGQCTVLCSFLRAS